MKRRIIALAMCVLLALSAVLSAACTGKNDDNPTPAPVTDEPTAEPTAAPTAAPTEAPTGVVFVNGLETTVDSLYITSVTDSEWGEPIAESILPEQIAELAFADFNGESGYVFDVGVVDENGMNYDIWNVELTDGDELRLTGDGEIGDLIVTHADGTTSEYEAVVYSENDQPGEKAVMALIPCTEIVNDQINACLFDDGRRRPRGDHGGKLSRPCRCDRRGECGRARACRCFHGAACR